MCSPSIGKVEKNESFLSTHFLNNSTYGIGDHVSCQPALLKVDDNFFMVLPPDENDTLANASIEKLQIAVRSEMSFKWTLVEVGDEPNTGSRKAATGFLYKGERTNCTVGGSAPPLSSYRQSSHLNTHSITCSPVIPCDCTHLGQFRQVNLPIPRYKLSTYDLWHLPHWKYVEGEAL